MGSIGEREKFVYVAELAKLAKRYDEMVDAMKNVAKLNVELTEKERDLLSAGYMNLFGRLRASWRILSSIERKEESVWNLQSCTRIKKYRQMVESELTDICNDIISVLEKHLIPSCTKGESSVFYNKMRGDYYKYLVEFKTGNDREEVADLCKKAYQAATSTAEAELHPTHPLRLDLALSFSVFYYEILNSPERAYHLAKQCISELDTLSEESDIQNTSTIQLLRENLTSWTSEIPEDADGLDAVKKDKPHLTVLFFGDSASHAIDNILQHMGYSPEAQPELKPFPSYNGGELLDMETRRFIMMHALGYDGEEMIGEDMLADIAVLVTSAEESGYDKKALKYIHKSRNFGSSQLLILVDKLDLANFSEEIFEDIIARMKDLVRTSCINLERDVQFVPVSSHLGTNIIQKIERNICPWFNGPCLAEALTDVSVSRDHFAPFRMPIIVNCYSENFGGCLNGKIEYGTIHERGQMMIMPDKVIVDVGAILYNGRSITSARPGQIVHVIYSVDKSKVQAALNGQVLCSVDDEVRAVTCFTAQLYFVPQFAQLFFVPPLSADPERSFDDSPADANKLYIHSIDRGFSYEIHRLKERLSPHPCMRPRAASPGDYVICDITVDGIVCVDNFFELPQLGKFILRRGDDVFALGRVTGLPALPLNRDMVRLLTYFGDKAFVD